MPLIIKTPKSPAAQCSKYLCVPYVTCLEHVNRGTLLVIIVLRGQADGGSTLIPVPQRGA